MNSNIIHPFLSTLAEGGMKFEISRPWLALIIIPALALALIPFFRLHKSRRYNIKHVVPLILHILILTLAVALITGVKVTEIAPAPTESAVIIVADVSDSNIAMKDKMNAYIKDLVESSDEHVEIGVVIFANDASYYHELGDDPVEDYLDLEGKEFLTGTTDIQKALDSASKILSQDKYERVSKRILLMSDGRQTVNNAWEAAEMLASKDIRLDGAYFDVAASEGYSEVQILSLKTDVIKDKSANVSVSFAIKSTSSTTGKITFYEIPQGSTDISEAEEVYSSKLRIEKGSKSYNFKYMADDPGIHSVYAVVETDDGSGDSIVQNNTLYSWFSIDDIPKILLVDGDGTQVTNKITSLIEKEDCDYEVVDTKDFPDSMEKLLEYDEIVLMNIDFADMPMGATNLVKRYVEEIGRGLVFTCGSNSYDYNDGSFANNPLIDILPVDLKIDETRETIATVITVDLSSSMGNYVGGDEICEETGKPMTRYDMVKQSVIAVLDDESFSEADYVGIIFFNSEAVEAVPLTQLSEKEWIIDEISFQFESQFYYHTDENNPTVENRVSGSGTQDKNGYSIKSFGTTYSNAISKSSEMLSNSDADLKQLVFLSDGEPSDKGQGYAGTIERMAATGTTTSTILIGNDNQAMVDELSNLATIGHGKFTQVFTKANLSDSLVKIAESKKGELINERDTQLEKRNESAITVGVSNKKFDIIGGYYGTTAKEKATIIFSADDLRPIIAEWKVGLGHATVYMSDLGGKWSESLFTYDESNEDDADNIMLVQNLLVNSLNSKVDSSGLKVSSQRVDDTTKITVETEKKFRDNEKLVAYVTDMAGNVTAYEDENAFVRLSDTKRKAEILTKEASGVYHIEVKLVDKQTNAVYDKAEFAVVGFYPDEYDLFNIDGKSILEDVVTAGEGEMIENADEFLAIKREGFVQYVHTYSTLFITILLILFLLDLFFRHFSPKKKSDSRIMTDEEQYESMRGR